tara:strand:+ start:12 stop:266 length:255 start_codon:yes stop_codon:yes gene_type:complete
MGTSNYFEDRRSGGQAIQGTTTQKGQIDRHSEGRRMSGEDPKIRRTMENMARQMVDNGARPDYAIRKARQAAINADRKKEKTKR